MRTWSEAFAAQAKSDRDAYYLLSRSTLPTCHRLHYLQMWLEKLCKAYVLGTEAEAFRTTHNVVAKVLPRLISEHWRRIGFAQPPRTAEIRGLCREIDFLHPQVDDNNRRADNVEYPWPGSGGTVEVPAQWKFSLSGKLDSHSGRLLLKAAARFTQDPAVFIR
jgi:hypothetical protein